MPTAFKVGLLTKLPPVAASYHVIPLVDDNAELAFNVWIGLISHCVISPLLAGADGAPVMVNFTDVLVKLVQVPSLYSA